MKLLFSASIPVSYHATKKNSRPIMWNKKTNRPFVGKNKRLVSAERELLSAFSELKRDLKIETITYPVSVKMIFEFENYYTAKGIMNKKLPDMSNLYQLVEDCLQKSGIIFDDYLIENHDGSCRRHGAENCIIIELSSVDNI